MEFTPKKVSSNSRPFRSGNYSTDGKVYLNRFKASAHRSKPYSEPQRRVKTVFQARSSKKGLFNRMSDSKGNSNAVVSRGESLLKASLTSQNEQPKTSFSFEKTLPQKSFKKSADSELFSKKGPTRLNSPGEPCKLFNESDDDEIFLNAIYETKNNSDKENDDGSCSTTKFYPKKKKPLAIRRSSILSDISPAKVERAYGNQSTHYIRSPDASPQSRPTRPTNIECTPDPVQPVTTVIDDPHDIGFLNYGNTCYLNAVLQSLLGLLPFISDISSIVRELDLPTSSITHSLWKVIMDRQQIDVTGIRKSLRHIKENLEKVDCSFSGFKMQDANEFLTQVLDTVKDEINRSILSSVGDSQNVSSTSEKVGSASPSSLSLQSCSIGSEQTNLDASLSNTSNTINSDSIELRLKDEGYTSSEECEIVLVKKNGEDIQDSPDISLLTKSTDSAMEAELSSSNLIQIFSEKDNPINKNFEFELLESYRCLGCGHVEGRRQSHYALYVDLPRECEGEESIREAVEAYMGEDERELTCAKCNHPKAVVTTCFNKFPRILIVQMKRYEYKPDQFECIKVSSRVKVDMWLHLDNLALDDVTLPLDWVPSPLNCSAFDKKSSPAARNLFDQKEEATSSDMVTSTVPISEDTSIECLPDTLPEVLDVKEMQVAEHNGNVVTGEDNGNVVTGEDNGNVTFGPSQWSDENALKCSEVEPLKCDEESEKEKEEKELQEVMLRSMEDVGPPSNGANNPEKEEEEIQKAIRLSLQDMGMCYSSDVESVEMASEEKESSEKQAEGNNSYRLLSLISHFGLTTCTGHYVSDVYNCSKSQWFHYDDEQVAKLQEAVVLAEGRQKNGYIFFYAHNDICKLQSNHPL